MNNKRLKELAEHRRCIETLTASKELLEKFYYWEDKTHAERVEKLRLEAGNMVADIYEDDWSKCGPI